MPGDGIGKEVMPEGIRVLDAVAERFGLSLDYTFIEWGSCEYYQAHGTMMPSDWRDQLSKVDAIYFGAVGWPESVPDHVSLWGSIVSIRQGFDQYVNIRPCRTFEGVASPLKNCGPQDIDMVIVRENTEGEYTSLGGVMFQGTPRELVVQESVHTRLGTNRILEFAFELAEKRSRRRLTVATKSNGLAVSMPWWDERAREVASKHPEVRWDKQHIDILCARFVLMPQNFDVVVASNLFGDILSDLGPACTGTIGLAASANLNPERRFPSLFEPVHGSAPDICGKNIANPVAMVWAGAMMLSFLGGESGAAQAAHDAILESIEGVLRDGPHTPDMGGTASTREVGEAIVRHIRSP